MLCWAKGYSQFRAADDKLTLRDTASKVYNQKLTNLYRFPNLNQPKPYFNKASLKQIQKLIQEEQYEQAYPLLYDYVSHFSVRNFFQDNRMLWQLARLEEIKGDTLTAIGLYKLVLKHYHPDMNINLVREKLNLLDNEKKTDYVPLKYYYELVEYRKEIDTLRPPQGVYLNMGDGINSAYNDYGPALSATDDIMIFTSKRNTIDRDMKSITNEDMMYSRMENGLWTDAMPLTQVNSAYNEGSACISKDGKTIYFSRCNAPDGLGSCDLYQTNMQENGEWSQAKNLGPKINSTTWDSHPSLSHLGDTLYFASDRLGGFGMEDIYFICKDQQGQWSAPQNAGPVINTRGRELSPFYHPSHQVLYYSSDGHLLNFGEFDIYKSYKDQGLWGEPKNIGPLVNGVGSEYYFTIDAASKNLYYARSEEENMGNLDLYSFPLPMEAQPTARIKLSGTLKDEATGKPFSNGIVSIIDLDNGIEVAPKFLRQDGSFEFSLINNNNYLIIIQGEDFFRLEEIFYLNGTKEFHRTVSAISSRLKFNNMKFDNGKSALKSEMYGDLDKIANFLLDNPSFKLRIEGHTDTDGNAELNLKLSQQRADAIKDYLVNFGSIEGSRIEAIGYGSSKPIVAEKSEADKQLNRRVEFNIYR